MEKEKTEALYTPDLKQKILIFGNIAQYDANGVLTGISTLNKQLSETVINKKPSLTATPKDGDKTLKAFCWDADTLNPYGDLKTINAAE